MVVYGTLMGLYIPFVLFNQETKQEKDLLVSVVFDCEASSFEDCVIAKILDYE